MSNNIKQNQIISITGATATGKTQLALDLAKKILAETEIKRVQLLSVDSRQVFQGLEVLTGADIPHGWRTLNDYKYPYFINPDCDICLHGVSIIEIWQEWSVAHFKKMYQEIKSRLAADEVLILVGGTGFYHRQIQNGAETVFVLQDSALRQRLEKKSSEVLQAELQKIDREKLESMNQSDINNPRRLIRAIEVANYLQRQQAAENAGENKKAKESSASKPKIKKIHLVLDKKERDEKIIRRVEARFKDAVHEVRACFNQFKLTPQLPAYSSTGFSELCAYLDHDLKKEQALRKWQISEMQYAKRQDTWWKKVDGLEMLDANDPELLEKAWQILL